MASLYELSNDMANFDLKIDEETGEVINIDELNALQMSFNEKAENIIKFIKNLDAEVVALESEENALAERRKAKEKKIEALKNYLKFVMEANGNDKLEFVSGVANFRKSKSVKVGDEFMKWAKENGTKYLLEKEPTISKSAIRADLELGVEVPFAEVVENKSLIIK